ncbi:MAG: leucine--tRNA ligase [Endomicrobium sp.]|nr:leucine--tRNA ligase [Endomicrobium sp.]
MLSYDYTKIEKKWQKKWIESKIFESKEVQGKEKYYCLSMFSYPSGNLHMGHFRNYSIGDVLARFYKMKGKNILHPVGWDAFGLPAENAAIKNNIHPFKWTKRNINCMRKQLKSFGISYDWSREITTCDPRYYKWSQWLFIKMWQKGLIFRKNANVNWCSSCNTVLANEQVLNGICWRCSNRTEHINLEQWFIKITNYADELLSGHKYLIGWPKQVIVMQKDWIGKSFGVEINFTLSGSDKKLKVFTTKPETLFGVTFIVVAPENEIINEISTRIKNYDKVLEYINMSKEKSNIDRVSCRQKTGIKLEGIMAINPATKKRIPVFTADYVLSTYATGAIMAVPAHDQRDWEFAKKKGIPIIKIIANEDNSSVDKCAYEGEGILINSKQFDGIRSIEASNIVSEWIEKQNFGKKTTNFKLKDWLISRQRYWGTPIPMIHCKICGVVPVLDKDLPVILPKNINFTGKSESPLKSNKVFLSVKCPQCNMDATRETDTMDTFIDSSWYYLRYCDARNMNVAFDTAKVNYWMPVDQYIGGIEHACMHLIYSRFWYKVMRDLNFVKHDEPFVNLLTQGMVTLNGNVMSKSKGNIVNPDKIIKKYGVDTARLFILFSGPPQKQLDWSEKGIEGCWKFINRIWLLFDMVNKKAEIKASEKDKSDILKIMHQTIKKVTINVGKTARFNTAISSIMELVNALYRYKHHLNDNGVSMIVYKTVILLMTPFTPHVCEEIWEMLGYNEYISTHMWPNYNENVLKKYYVELPVQINGKLKGKITVSMKYDEYEVKKVINANEKIMLYLKNKHITKFIYIKNKIISIVAN